MVYSPRPLAAVAVVAAVAADVECKPLKINDLRKTTRVKTPG